MKKEDSARNRKYPTWGNYPGVNLKFLLEFMKYLGVTAEDYGKMGATSAQALRLQLRNDDMKVSKAKEIVRTLGYKLEIELLEKEVKEDTEETYAVILPKEKVPTAYKSYRLKNIPFLDEWMEKRRLSQRKMGELLNCSSGAVESWIKTDDMPISYVNKMKEALNLRVKYEITKE